MKKTFLKPLAMAMLAFTFGCSSSNQTADSTNPMDVETADEPDVIGDNADMPVNNEISYADMFENVENTESYNILDLARMDENLSTFVRLVELSGLDASLMMVDNVTEGEGVTVFIPTNEAFKQMPEERFEYLIAPENRTALVQVVKQHILPTEVPSIQFNSSQIIETEGENEIPITTDNAGNLVFIGGAQIVKPDIEASNGIIHVVNGVIEPSEFNDVTVD